MKRWYKQQRSIFVQDPRLRAAINNLSIFGFVHANKEDAQALGKMLTKYARRKYFMFLRDNRLSRTVIVKSPYVKIKLTDNKLEIFPEL